MVTVPISQYSELARWVFDRNALDYRQESHAPILHIPFTRLHGGGIRIPVVNAGDTTLTDAHAVFEFYEQRASPEAKLFPTDPADKAEAQRMFEEFYEILGLSVAVWAYAYMLPRPAQTIEAWSYGVGAIERRILPSVYGVIAASVRRALHIETDAVPAQREVMDPVFDRVDALLADGRRYLVGDRLTAADVAFAVFSAFLFLPPEYGPPALTLDDLPAPMREEVEEFRTRPCGVFGMRIFSEDRPPRRA